MGNVRYRTWAGEERGKKRWGPQVVLPNGAVSSARKDQVLQYERVVNLGS